MVVAIARHIDPDLTPEAAVTHLANRADVRARVRDAIVERAPPHLIIGGREALARSVDALMADWIATAADITANGSRFYYGQTAQRLLHVPLDPALPNLPPAHRQFVAGRSMSDVEPSTVLKPRDPYNNPIAGDEDAA